VSESMSQPVASVRGYSLSMTRGRQTKRVLSDINLDIAPGEILGLVGESGSGKSMLAMSLLGLLPAAAAPQPSGEIEVCGVNLFTVGPAQLRAVRKQHLGAIFQDPMTSLNPTMKVGRQITEKSGTLDDAIASLDLMGVPEPATRAGVYPYQLSGGLRQRVMAAIATAGAPSLVVADEPTTALDVTVQAQLLKLLVDLRDRFGCAILMITHDLAVAAQVTDRIAVMGAGQIVEIGPTAKVLGTPQHELTQRLMDSRLTLESPKQPTAPPANGTLRPFALEISEVSCTYSSGWAFQRKQVHAVREVTLRVRQGESLSIVGESGSGKSTLLRAIAGLITPSRGKILLGEGGAQMVFQDAGSSLTPWLTVEQLLTERLAGSGLNRDEKQTRVIDALASMGLDAEVTAAKAKDLSGGQRQRVALVRATIVPPAVLLCDEPTSALDASRAEETLDLLQRLRHEQGTTIVFVTHDLAVARLMGDHIAVMKSGEVVEYGEADDVVRTPQHEYTRTLLAAVPRIDITEGGAK
jgi:peptide/nickel transport system ATP-binding protein